MITFIWICIILAWSFFGSLFFSKYWQYQWEHKTGFLKFFLFYSISGPVVCIIQFAQFFYEKVLVVKFKSIDKYFRNE